MQTIIVTGCASGIGRHLAAELYRRGHRVVATDVNFEGLRKVVSEDGLSSDDRVLSRALDVRDVAAWDRVVEETVERFGKLDVLLNVAGYLRAAWAKDALPEDVDRTFDINTKGMIHGTRAALRRMVPQGSGHVINIASIAGIVPVPGLSLYSASKHAIRAYSIAVAEEVRAHGVYVTAVCPGVVATPMMDIQLDKEEAALVFTGRRPLRVEEVGRVIIDRVMTERPLELVLDAGGFQGALSKLANAFPSMLSRFGAQARKRGRSNQSQTKSSE